MNGELYIDCSDGISIPQQRQLLELTKTMMRALTEEEFLAIVNIYDKAISRVLSKEL